jgi:cytochrome P450
VDGAIKTAIKEKRRARAAEEPEHDDLLSCMLTASEGETAPAGAGATTKSAQSAQSAQSGSTEETDAGIVDNLKTFFFGGYDTTSIAISFTLWTLANRPVRSPSVSTEICTQGCN